MVSALKLGKFALLLDGFDELETPQSRAIAADVKKFADEFPLNTIRIASRPDVRFLGWPGFSIVKTEPLNEEQACHLIAKLPADETIKLRFTNELRAGLFEENESFLSSPLLLTIMLITYRSNAEIPRRRSVFYSQAYSALFSEHDAAKGGFRRVRHSSLDIHEFSDVFSAFSTYSYDDNRHEFAKLDLMEYVDAAATLTGREFDHEGFCRDAIQGVCLLVQDGLNTKYTHRSFQEYFVAKFISTLSPSEQQTLIDRYSERYPRDNVLPLLHEICPQVLEKCWAIPFLNGLATDIGYTKGEVTVAHWMNYLLKTHESLEYDAAGPVYEVTYQDEFPIQQLKLILQLYGENVEQINEARPVDFYGLDMAKYSDPVELIDDGVYSIPVVELSEDAPVAERLFQSASLFGCPSIRRAMLIRKWLKEIRAKDRKKAISTLLEGRSVTTKGGELGDDEY